MTDEDDLSAAAQQWVEHLRAGGSTPWLDWLRSDTVYGADGPVLALPGAAQLDLLRRLNEARPATQLSHRVLSRAPVGRGAAETALPLAVGLAMGGSADPQVGAVLRRHPDVVPPREILRVATGVLVDLLLEAVSESGRPRRRSTPILRAARAHRRHSGSPGFVLAGAPGSVAALRARLTAVGLHPLDPHSSNQVPECVIIVTEPLVAGLADVWTARVQAGSARPWRGFVARSSRGQLPAPVSYARTAQRWAAEIGPRRVHVVTQDGLLDQIENILGARPSPVIPARAVGDPEKMRPVQVDVLRRVNAVMAFRSAEHALVERRSLLVEVMRESQDGPPWVDLPAGRRAWAAESARRMSEELQASDVTVHGDLRSIAEWKSRRWARLRRRDVVDAMVMTIHRVEEVIL